MKLLGKYFKDFLLRGLISMGFGPIVLSVVYGILGLTNVVDYVGVAEMVVGIISITLLAFLSGGLTIVYKIEEISLPMAISLHGIILYFGYVFVYVSNHWLKGGFLSFAIFTIIFIVSYAVIWTIIYLTTKNATDKLNKKINK